MLKDKKIVIIGGTTGLGLSAAKAFIGEGAKVTLVGRNPDNCKKAKMGFLFYYKALYKFCCYWWPCPAYHTDIAKAENRFFTGHGRRKYCT